MFGVLAAYGRICFEYALDNVAGQIVLEPIASVRLRFDVGQKCTRHTCVIIFFFYFILILEHFNATMKL